MYVHVILVDYYPFYRPYVVTYYELLRSAFLHFATQASKNSRFALLIEIYISITEFNAFVLRLHCSIMIQ